MLAAGTIAGVAVVNAATTTSGTSETQTRQVVADPIATPSVAPLELPGVKDPRPAPAPAQPQVIEVPVSNPGDPAQPGNGQKQDDDDNYQGGEQSDDGGQYVDDEQGGQDEYDDEQYQDDEHGDEDHGDEGGHDDDDD